MPVGIVIVGYILCTKTDGGGYSGFIGDMRAGDPSNMVHVVHLQAPSALRENDGIHTHAGGDRGRRVHFMHQNRRRRISRIHWRYEGRGPIKMVHVVHPTVGAANIIGPSGEGWRMVHTGGRCNLHRTFGRMKKNGPHPRRWGWLSSGAFYAPGPKCRIPTPHTR